MKKKLILPVFLITLAISGCSAQNQSATVSSNTETTSDSNDLIDVYMDINHYFKDGQLGFYLETNLPDTTKLSANLHSIDNNYKSNSGDIEVLNNKSSFRFFNDKGKSLPAGNYELTVFVSASTKQNEEVLSVVGNGFKNLTGDLINNKSGISVEKTIPITVEKQKEVPSVNTTNITTTTIDYEIKAVDDTSIGPVIRKSLRIFVGNPQDLTQENFEKLCQNVVKDYTSTTPINALTLYFFDNERDVNGGYTLGMCTYYPNGNIGDAMNIQAGDYSSFKYNYTFEKRDTAKMPTDAEFEVYDYFMDLLVETDGSEESEAECTKQTAEKFNITIEEVDNIFIKVSAYKLS